jgi:hypothetical protein
MTAPPVYECVTVNLIEKASAALDGAAGISGHSKTDTINRAIQIYQFVLERTQAGDELLLRHSDGTTERVHLL